MPPDPARLEPHSMSWRRRPLRWLAVLLLGVAAIGAGWSAHQLRSSTLAARTAGQTLLAVTLPDGLGRDVSLAQFKGRVVVVNFWASWCAPCREEMPLFATIQREFAHKGVQFVGIAVDQADKARAVTEELRIDYPILVGGYGALELSRALGNRLSALPFTLVLDRDGLVVHTQLGPLTEPQLRLKLTELL